MVSNAKEQIRRYWNTRAGAYAGEFGHGFFNQTEFNLWSAAVARNLPVLEGKEALDLGTGPGFMALVLSRFGFRATGVDVSEEMLRIARDNAFRAGASIDFHQADAESPPFADQTYDLVICRHLMWTLTDLEKTITAWKGLLKVNGCLIIIDGVWFPQGVLPRIRRAVADVVKTVRTKKFPTDWKRAYVVDQRVLPHINGVFPETILEVLDTCGFDPIKKDLLPDIAAYERRHAPMEFRLRHAGSPRYLIAGIKK